MQVTHSGRTVQSSAEKERKKSGSDLFGTTGSGIFQKLDLDPTKYPVRSVSENLN